MTHYQVKSGPCSSHQQIAAIVRELGQSPVLDVGSAQGILGQLLYGSGLEIDAIEPNTQWADAARPFYRQVQAKSIESAQLPDRHYRVVVCADVLEHTVDPAAVLKRLRRCAADDATFVISLPNVAHVSIRLMLLLGMFPKMDRGILDRTHLHFYTRATAVELLRSAGLHADRVLATPVPIELLGRSDRARQQLAAISKLQRPLVRFLPKLFAFQWILTATGGSKAS